MTIADISVLIPWRTDHGQRQRIHDRLLPLWHDTGLDICVGVDDPGGPFNINRALNRARTQARGDMLVVMGADHIPDGDHLRAAVETMAGKAWSTLYTRRAILTRQSTERILAGVAPGSARGVAKRVREVPGIVAVRASVWDDLGGRDERFAGWGGEDRAYRMALATLHGPPRQCQGTVWDLWHQPTGKRTPGNAALVDAYRAARGDPVRMRAVLAGR